MKEIKINAAKLMDKTSMAEYTKKIFSFPSYYGGNLDALRDSMLEIDEETDIILDNEAVSMICANDYAYRVLMVMSNAAEENPNIRILFR